MPVRHVVLAITGAAVLVLAVYLFFAVRGTAAATPTVVPGEPAPAAPPTASEPIHSTPTRVAPRAIASTAPTPAAPADESSAASYDDQPFDVDDAMRTNVKLELIMDQANRSYDHQDYSKAKQIALHVLGKQPGNIRMMRIMVSASCMDGDLAVAQTYYTQLPKSDREQMKRRCDANGATLQDPPP